MAKDNTIIVPRASFCGLKRLQVRRHGRLRLDTGWTPNLITDLGLEEIGKTGDLGRYCVVGIGNAAPSVSNTQLQTPVAIKDYNAGGGTQGWWVETSDPRYGANQRTYAFPQGAVVGNIAEVGVGWTNSLTTPLFSRSLVSPAISIIEIDQLTVAYQVRMYVPTWESPDDDITGTVEIAGEDYDYLIRPLFVEAGGIPRTDWGWAAGLLVLGASARLWSVSSGGVSGCAAYKAPCVAVPITGSVLTITEGGAGQNSLQADGINNVAYAENSKQADFDWSFSAAAGNFDTGIQGFRFRGLFGTYQMVMSAPIPKDNTKALTLRFRQTWARR